MYTYTPPPPHPTTTGHRGRRGGERPPQTTTTGHRGGGLHIHRGGGGKGKPVHHHDHPRRGGRGASDAAAYIEIIPCIFPRSIPIPFCLIPNLNRQISSPSSNFPKRLRCLHQLNSYFDAQIPRTWSLVMSKPTIPDYIPYLVQIFQWSWKWL